MQRGEGKGSCTERGGGGGVAKRQGVAEGRGGECRDREGIAEVGGGVEEGRGCTCSLEVPKAVFRAAPNAVCRFFRIAV